MATDKNEVSGKDIIVSFLKGEPSGIIAYKKICTALSVFDSWGDSARLDFLDRLLDIGDLLDENCKELVTRLCKLPWTHVPPSQLPHFQRMMCEIALRHISHTESIYDACTRYFKPLGEQWPEEKQETMYNLAHSIIAQVLRCVPMSDKVLKRSACKFPHFSSTAEVFVNFLRNVILLGEYATELRAEIWDAIIHNLLILDNTINRATEDDFVSLGTEIFLLEEDKQVDSKSWSDQSAHCVHLLDQSMRTVFDFISVKMGRNVRGAEWLRVGPHCDIFDLLAPTLDNYLLMSVDARYVPFIWLFVCNLNPNYPNRLFEWLWSRITLPQRAQSDAKKSHGAAAYLGAFLARASFVDIDEAFDWLRRICDWLTSYLDSRVGSSVTALTPGAVRHGTFYALCQTFFIIFCFRYKRIRYQTEKFEEMRRWCLMRIFSSPLDPLKYVSRPVSLCFSTITRTLELVYCSHLVPVAGDDSNCPFEPMFPLDSYGLPETSVEISELMRKFAPLHEDVEKITSILQSTTNDNKTLGAVVEESMEFLDEEEEVEMHIGSHRTRGDQSNSTYGIPVVAHSDMFSNLYATSPGTRPFDVTCVTHSVPYVNNIVSVDMR